MRLRFIFICLCLLFIVNGFGAEVEFKASINSDKIGLDDILVYTVSLKGVENPSKPDLSSLAYFKISHTARSTEFRFVNGSSSHYVNYTYYLIPLKKGILTIPSVSYTHEGKTYKTESFKVEVIKGSVATPAPVKRRRRSVFDDDVFESPFERGQRKPVDVKLKSRVSKRRVVLGEEIIYKVLLYSRNNIESVNMISKQSFPGFWQEWYPVPRSIEGKTESMDGKNYKVFEIRKAVLFPTKSGEVKIPSLRFELTLSTDPFSFFSSSNKIYRSSSEVRIVVSDPPAEAAGLPVGNFNFSVSAVKNEVDINDIFTVKLNIFGNGNIKTLTIPQFKTNDYYKVYPAKISRNFDFNKERLYGIIESEIPISFKKPGLISFPSIQFKYFDPQRSEVISSDSTPMVINVTGSLEKQEGIMTLPKSEIIRKGEDIDFIKKGNVYDQSEHFYKKGYFLYLFFIPFLFNLLVIIKIFVVDRFIIQSTVLKKKKLLAKTLKNLKSVRDYGEIFSILENYLKEKAGLGFSEINNQTIEDLFAKFGISNRYVKMFIQIKTESESSRFSPIKKSERELRHDLKLAVDIIKKIDKKIK